LSKKSFRKVGSLMSPDFRAEIEEIRDKADILSVISDYVQLKKVGQRYVGLCPFHSEKTPSFSVSPDRGFFHCFGCGQGGDVFTFIQLIERVEFPEALRMLAERFGVKLAEKGRENTGLADERADIYKLCSFAEAFFVKALQSESGKQARAYLADRGINPDIAAQFRVGYAPSGSLLYKVLKSKNVSPERMERAGLVIWGQNGYFDRFRERLMFPIRDHRKKVVGFGGRVLGDGVPKYLNSPESAAFSKGRILYGLDSAAESIRQNNRVFVVEGYMDVLALRQFGLNNVVASLGTAFTEFHARLLARYAKQVYLCYDADTAGKAATVKGLHILKQQGLEVHITELPSGEDPDTYVQRYGIDAFLALAEKGPGIIEFQIARVLEGVNLNQPENVARAVKEALPILGGITDAIERDLHIGRLGAAIGVSPDSIRQQMRHFLAQSQNNSQIMDINAKNSHTKHVMDSVTMSIYSPIAPAGYPHQAILAEQELLKQAALTPEAASEINKQTGGFVIELHQQLLNVLASYKESGKEALYRLFETLDEPKVRYVRELMLKADEEAASGRKFDVGGCIERVREGRILLRIHQLEQEILKRETTGVLETGDVEMSEILTELRELHGQLRTRSAPR
jgi:DNA primase